MSARLLRLTICFVLAGSVFVFAQGSAAGSEYIYVTPPGWNATQYPDGFVLMSPPSVTNERCVVTLIC
jgi:hypothetical protein